MTRTLLCTGCHELVDCIGLSYADALVLHILTTSDEHPQISECFTVDSLIEDLETRAS